jgi:hypothetical protein
LDRAWPLQTKRTMRNATIVNLLGLTLVVTPFFFAAPSAQACSGSPPGNVSSRLVIPADGATSVPTNVQIVVTYLSLSDTHPMADHLALKTAGGASVPVTISQPVSNTSGYLIQKVFVLVPTAPLQPNTSYSVFSDIATLPCDQNDYRMSGSPHPPCTALPDGGMVDGGAYALSTAISAFTTGSGPDQTSPTLSGDITFTAEAQSCNAGACCGPYDGFSVSMGWTAAADGSGPMFYELSREGVVLRYPIQDGQNQIAASSVRGAFLCSGNKGMSVFSTFGFEDFQGQPGNYKVVAVDLAGNRSQAISVDVTVDCTIPDGGPMMVDVAPGIDSLGGSWDGLYALVDMPPANPDLVVVADAPTIVDTVASPDTTPILHGDAGIPDVAILVGRDGPVAAEDLKPASPDGKSTSPDAGPSVHPNDDGGGCSCRVGGGADGFASIVLVGLGLALTVRSRRARHRK